jgi:hypothetical protein
MRLLSPVFLTAFVLASLAWAQTAELSVPAQVMAGSGFSVSSRGSGAGTLYLIGPSEAIKRAVELGGGLEIAGEELEHAGRYQLVICGAGSCASAGFYVHPAAPGRLSLLVHPSRVPVSDPNAISAVALVFDDYHNLILEPQPVKFTVIPTDGAPISETRSSDHGVSWIRLSSSGKGGPAKLEAALDKTTEVRVVQQVASDACNLRIKSSLVAGRAHLETDPVRDCNGNAIPDGTVVSFTKQDTSGKTTVDVPIKRGIATVEMPVSGRARITVASGVVTGNELLVGGGK